MKNRYHINIVNNENGCSRLNDEFESLKYACENIEAEFCNNIFEDPETFTSVIVDMVQLKVYKVKVTEVPRTIKVSISDE